MVWYTQKIIDLACYSSGCKCNELTETPKANQSYKREKHSAGAKDEMHTAIGVDDIGYLAYVERVRRLLKRLLHHSTLEPAKVTAVAMWGVVGVGRRELCELVRVAVDLRLVLAQQLDRLFFRARDICLFPAGRPSAAFVLNKQMARAHLLRLLVIKVQEIRAR